VYLLSVIGLIACKDVRLYEASSCPLTSPAIVYKRREIERRGLPRRAILHIPSPIVVKPQSLMILMQLGRHVLMVGPQSVVFYR